MSVTTIDLDDDALEKAMRVAGGGTKKDVVNAALREYAERHQRAALVAKHFRTAQHWDYEGWQRRRAEDKQSRA
ncbi:type II toxin-antitoxin system VapB family antitoxin [Streptomyces sp. WAC 00631]|uniref:type II toxin-antitoxin system VapB family antitoxin n=1 Tax=unclassified Streptomyces TaxID=2593676 RepID=UPI000F795AF7|nr:MULTISPECIES: type II toxin-antitoxin system VapB family antitoxin [unclassified Streptomyces]MCC5033706.1 type II toxin-antitoxin system VapB family antitoxin [Streptomyces sp. WAC 00631]MCC9742904.1 type II toxin-antitoxin system VapB family antitoxin [Streptomyces sp. MNU89]